MDDSADESESTLPLSEGLRERKKRLTRQLISDTATGMFLEHGFDAVRIIEIAAACGVSEKTVYNYFPTKESLVLDRGEALANSISTALGPGAPERSPIAAALEVLSRELHELRAQWDFDAQAVQGLKLLRRFTDLVAETPSLRAAQRDMMDHLARVAAEAMAERAGVSPDDPEPQIAAQAILGLWSIQSQGLRRYAEDGLTPDEVFAKVTDDVQRAARLIDGGLWAFAVIVAGTASRDQLRVAAEAAQRAAKQVAAAVRQARDAWRQVQHDAHDAGQLHSLEVPDKRTQRMEFERWKRDLKHDERRRAIELHHERARAKREQANQRKRDKGG